MNEKRIFRVLDVRLHHFRFACVANKLRNDDDAFLLFEPADDAFVFRPIVFHCRHPVSFSYYYATKSILLNFENTKKFKRLSRTAL